ncbi:MAG: hypothetical protein N3A69_01010 [Leptospiraceae bacterium]|nr:hypothetical protein [Leptospiraceae bacterium]
MKIYFSLIFSLLLTCGKTLEYREIPLSEKKFQIAGKIVKLPNELREENFSLEIRFYNCPNPNFGKLNADSGIYPYQKEDCRLAFSKQEFSVNKEKFSQEVQIPLTWTHGFVFLKGIEKVRGKYSVGENPFWFLATDIVENTLSVTFEFSSTENPIPDKEQYALAQKFAPILVLKKDKKFIPTNLSKYYGKYKVVTRENKKDSSLYEHSHSLKDDYLELDESLYGKGETHLYFHVRYANTFVSGSSPKALPNWRDNFNYKYIQGDGSKVISYFFWYDYNEGPSPLGNRHEGDLESFAILVDAKGNPKRIMFTGHNHIMLDTAWNNINSFNNHPILYIAHGRNSDGGNPTSPYGGYEVSLEAGNFLFNALANPKDIFPSIGEDSQIILPSDLRKEDLTNLRIGPGEWIDPNKTRYVNASAYVTRQIAKLVKWEEPAWLNEKAVFDPDKTHDVPKEEAFFMNWNGRIGRHVETKLNLLHFAQYGKSPVNPPFKMNEEQHFTLETPSRERCEKARIGDYCPKFYGDDKTPQFSK